MCIRGKTGYAKSRISAKAGVRLFCCLIQRLCRARARTA
nr:MAG TPA_asm: hypothetical protein [Caudoviricetes sp.]